MVLSYQTSEKGNKVRFLLTFLTKVRFLLRFFNKWVPIAGLS